MRLPKRELPEAEEGEEIVAVRWSAIRLFARRDSLIERSLIDEGLWEGTLHTRLRMVLSPGDTFVDCGANIGAHSCALAEHVGPKGRVIAIEPVPALADRLARNCALNGLTNVRIVRTAAASTSGRRVFYAPVAGDDNQGIGSFYAHQGSHGSRIEVETAPLDAILAEAGCGRVQAIKIDVEGAELDVLRGARRTLEREAPVVFFEYHAAAWHEAGVTMAEVERFLVDGYGYELTRLPQGSDDIHDLEATPTRAAQELGPWWRFRRRGR